MAAAAAAAAAAASLEVNIERTKTEQLLNRHQKTMYRDKTQ
jgi:hypothetical protein